MAAPPRDVYLADDFDPASLKVPQLRSILHEFGVRHRSTAKKADLVAHFVSEVKPRAAAILAQDARVRPSATGIIAVSSATGEEAPVEPVGAKRSRGRPRKTTTKEPKDDVEVEAPTAKRPRSRRATTATDIPSADEEPAPPAKTPKKRGRPSKKPKEPVDVDGDGDARMEDIQELLAPPPRKTPRKKSSTNPLTQPPAPPIEEPKPLPSSSGSDPLPQPPVEIPRTVPPATTRKPHTSFMPIAAKPEENATPPRKPRSSEVAEGSSPFSDYNPFQAGSAEAAEVARRRRKSSLGVSDGKRRAPRPSEWTATSQPSASILRKVGPSNENLRSPAPPTPRIAYADEVAAADSHNAVVERKFGEVTNSAPAEEEDIEVTTSTQVVQKPKRKAIIRRKPKPATTPTVPTVLFVLLISILCSYYKSLSSANGFCDNNSYTNSVILGRELPIKAAQECITQRSHFLADHPDETPGYQCDMQALPLVPFIPRPQHCTPCPPNAHCAGGEVVSCEPEYILKPSLLAPLSPLVDGWPMLPSRVFPPSCKPDTARMRQIGQLATQIERYLAKRRGTAECAGEAGDKAVGPGVRYGVSESDLIYTFAARRVDTIEREDFDDMFQRALSDLVAHKDVIESIDEYGVSFYTSARSDMSIACHAKLEAMSLLDQWKTQLGGSLAVILGIYALLNRVEAARTEHKAVRGYTDSVVRRLQDQEYRHFTDPVQTPVAYMPPAQLRDVILPASMGTGTRQRIWSKVEAKVEENANVLVREREVRGDVWKTWEWSALGAPRVEPAAQAPQIAAASDVVVPPRPAF